MTGSIASERKESPAVHHPMRTGPSLPRRMWGDERRAGRVQPTVPPAGSGKPRGVRPETLYRFDANSGARRASSTAPRRPPSVPTSPARASCSSRRLTGPAAALYDGWGSRTATRRTSPGKPVPRLDGRAAPSGAARRTRSTPAAARDREDGRPAMRTASSRRGVPPRGSSQARCYFLAWLALIAASMLLYFAAMMMTCGVTRAAAYANGLVFVAAYNNSVSEFHDLDFAIGDQPRRRQPICGRQQHRLP